MKACAVRAGGGFRLGERSAGTGGAPPVWVRLWDAAQSQHSKDNSDVSDEKGDSNDSNDSDDLSLLLLLLLLLLVFLLQEYCGT